METTHKCGCITEPISKAEVSMYAKYLDGDLSSSVWYLSMCSYHTKKTPEEKN